MRALVVGTAGHIDHGKSALVKALTGTDPDRLKEEQARGITIDLGFAHAEIGGVSVAFVDVPGHERFVRNMLAGAGGVDAVLLVIAADEAVMPQTREHFAICRLLGIERGVIALSKSDLADAETIALSTIDVRDLVAGSFLEGAPIVPVSARTGAGLDQLRVELAALAEGGRARSARAGIMRLPIDRAFTIKGFGTVVTGTLVSGSVAEGDMLEALPGRLAVRVRGLNVHGRLVAAIDAPSRAAVNIGALEPAAVPRGVTIATPGTLALTRHFDARIELLPEAQPLRHGTIARVHQGTAVITGVVSIGALRPRGSEDWTAVPAGTSAVHVEPGDEAYVRVRLHAGAAMTRLDRIVLRGVASATTIGGGVVLDPEPPSGGLRRAGSLERFRQLDGANVEAGLQGGRSAGLLRAAALWIVEASGRCVTAADLVRRGGTDLDTAQRALTLLVEEGRAVPSAQGFVDPGALDGLERRVRAVLEAFHRARPAEAGMPQESLRTQLTPRPAPGLFELGLDRLRMAGFVTGTDRVSLASHKPAVTEADAASRATIEDALRSGGLTPPGIDDIAARCGLPRDAFDRTLRALVSEGVVVKAGPLLLHRDVLARLVEDVRAAGSNAPASAGPGASRPAATIDVAWFKTRFGLSRKFAIPLLEHLDRVRVTRRVGDARLVL